jgi:hypothetical protein
MEVIRAAGGIISGAPRAAEADGASSRPPDAPSSASIRERRSVVSSNDRVTSAAAGVSSTLNFCAHASAGRQTSWSTETIMTIMAMTAYAIARRSPRSMATAMYAPIPGSRKSREPRVNASVTVRKNHSPAIDIIEFR